MNVNQTLAEIRDGRFSADLEAKLAEAITLAQELQGSAELTIKLTVKPIDEITVTVLDQITLKEPKREPGKSIFYIHDEDGAAHLSRKHPRQVGLFENPRADVRILNSNK